MVDLVRRGAPPKYARSVKWIHWANPGGIVWVFGWLWIAMLFCTFYMVTGSFGSAGGLPYILPEKQLREVDLVRLLGGQPVLGRNGKPIIDPTQSNVWIFAVRADGAPELKWRSDEIAPAKPTILILLPEATTTYQDVVSNVEALRRDHADARVWLAHAQRPATQPD